MRGLRAAGCTLGAWAEVDLGYGATYSPENPTFVILVMNSFVCSHIDIFVGFRGTSSGPGTSLDKPLTT